MLPGNYVRGQVAVSTNSRAFFAERLGQVKNDGHRLGVKALGQFHQRLARLGLDVGRIDHGQKAARQAAGSDKVQGGKRIVRGL